MGCGEIAVFALKVPFLIVDCLDVGAEVSVVVGGVVALVTGKRHDLPVDSLGVPPEVKIDGMSRLNQVNLSQVKTQVSTSNSFTTK